MSPKSIKAFQDAYPKWKPSPAVELRNEASKLRAFGQSLLAKANRLEEIASELSGPQCHCGTALTFDQNGNHLTCWCPNCKARNERDGHIIFVYGHGKDRASAFADWQEAVNRF